MPEITDHKCPQWNAVDGNNWRINKETEAEKTRGEIKTDQKDKTRPHKTCFTLFKTNRRREESPIRTKIKTGNKPVVRDIFFLSVINKNVTAINRFITQQKCLGLVTAVKQTKPFETSMTQPHYIAHCDPLNTFNSPSITASCVLSKATCETQCGLHNLKGLHPAVEKFCYYSSHIFKTKQFISPNAV